MYSCRLHVRGLGCCSPNSTSPSSWGPSTWRKVDCLLYLLYYTCMQCQYDSDSKSSVMVQCGYDVIKIILYLTQTQTDDSSDTFAWGNNYVYLVCMSLWFRFRLPLVPGVLYMSVKGCWVKTWNLELIIHACIVSMTQTQTADSSSIFTSENYVYLVWLRLSLMTQTQTDRN
jgi:hypothetical protein